MGQITYNYPGMLGTAGEMGAHGATLRVMGDNIAADQGILAATWTGETGMTYQAWQQQWNAALADLVQSYDMMRNSHENNTMTMMGRDQAEGAKWA